MSNVPPASTASKGAGVKKSAAKKLKPAVSRSNTSLEEQDKPHGSLAQSRPPQAGAVHAATEPPAENGHKVQEAVLLERIEEAVVVEDKKGNEQGGPSQAGATSAHLAEPGPPPATNGQKTRDTVVSAKDVVELWTKPAISPLAKNDQNIQEDITLAAATEKFGKLKLAGVLLDMLRTMDGDDWKEECPKGHKLKKVESHHQWHECSVCTRPLKKGAKIRWCVLCPWNDGSQFVLCEECTPSSDKPMKKSRGHLKRRLQAQELLEASEGSDLAILEKLLESRVNPCCKVLVREGGNVRVSSCLHAAVNAGFTKAIPVLLSYGAWVDVKDRDDRSPLHAAVVAKGLDAVNALLEGRADVNAQDSLGQRPIHLAACRRGSEAKDVLHVLLAARADANVEDRAGRVAYELEVEDSPEILEVCRMYDDAQNGQKASNRMALAVKKHCRVFKNHSTAKQLCDACAQGDVDTVKRLLEGGTKVSGRAPGMDLHIDNLRETRPILGWTPLHAAVEKESVDTVKILLEAQADVDARECSFDQLQPIHRAARSGNVLVLRLLASARADVNVLTWIKKKTPLHLAAKRGHTEVAKTLAELKADVAATNVDGQTALHVAAAFGQADTVEALLALQANPMTQDVKGKVALNMAMSEGNVDNAKHLLAVREPNKDAAKQMLAADEVGEDLVPHCWAAVINRSDCLATAIHDKTCTVVVRESDINLDLKATFCSVSPKTLLVEAPENLSPDVAPLLIPTTNGVALPVWSTLTRPPVTSKGRLVMLDDLGCDPTHQAIIRAFANTPNEAALSTPVATAILQHAWGGVEAWYYFEVLWCYFQLGNACIVTKYLNREGEAPQRGLIVMLVGIAKRALDELAQLVDGAIDITSSIQAPATLLGDIPELVKPVSRVSKCKALACAAFMHVRSPMNQVDAACLLLDTAAVMAAFNFDGTQFQTGVIGVSFATMWFRALYLLRGLRKFGTRMLPILSAVKDTLTFFIVMAFAIAAVTHYYYLTGGAGAELFPAFERVYRLCLWADFDIADWQGLKPAFITVSDPVNGAEWVSQDPPQTDMYLLLQILFYVTTMCVTVIFMNLLIAILNENFSQYETRSSALFQRERANLIITLRCCPLRLAFVLLHRAMQFLPGTARAAAPDSTVEGSAQAPNGETSQGVHQDPRHFLRRLATMCGVSVPQLDWKRYCYDLACLILPWGLTRYHYKYWDKETKPKLVFLEKVEDGEVDTTGEIKSTRLFLNQQMAATERRISQLLEKQREQLEKTLKAVQTTQANLDTVKQDLKDEVVAALRKELSGQPSSSGQTVTQSSQQASEVGPGPSTS